MGYLGQKKVTAMISAISHGIRHFYHLRPTFFFLHLPLTISFFYFSSGKFEILKCQVKYYKFCFAVFMNELLQNSFSDRALQ